MIETHLGISPRIYYAKPQDTSGQIVVSPWATDAITLTEQGTTGVYTFTRSASVAYVIYERVGATPASTDPIDGYADVAFATAGQAEAIKTKTDALPSNPAAVSDIPTASQNATAVRSELTPELAEIPKIPRAATVIPAGQYRIEIEGGQAANVTPSEVP